MSSDFKLQCDLVRPTCSRCVRLGILCVGSGVKRFKFQNKTVARELVMRGRGASLIPNPLSPTDLTANALMTVYAIDDLRYDISIFGDYFAFLPARLGQCEALDAATWAFTLSHSTSYSSSGPSSEAIEAYGSALTLCRKGLDDTNQACSINMLCALMLIQLCQTWIDRPNDPHVDHMDFISHILPSMIERRESENMNLGAGGGGDMFEYMMLILATLPVILLSMYKPPNLLHPSMHRLLSSHVSPRPHACRDGDPLQTLDFGSFWMIPRLTHEPRKHIAEIQDAYVTCLSDREKLWSRLAAMEDDQNRLKIDRRDLNISQKFNVPIRKLFAQLQNAMSTVLAIGLVLHGLIVAIHDPYGVDESRDWERKSLIDDTLRLAKDMLPLRPLYTCGFGPTILLAMAMEDDPQKLVELESMLKLYEIESCGTRWLDASTWWREYLSRLRLESLALTKSDHILPIHEEEVFAEIAEQYPISKCVIL